jgi:3'-phosphoadenosine 5'-phosphosulfate sulfotransferase (PAPS reductase)/FAD synthetase
MYKRRNIEHRVRQANQIIKEFLRMCSKPYVSFSGGKDSTVVLHLVSLIDKSIPVFTQFDDLDYPHKKKHCQKILEAFDMNNFYMVDTQESVWEMVGTDQKMDANDIFYRVIESFLKRVDCNGHFMGLRIEESKKRKMNYLTRGHIYIRQGMKVCTPIALWEGMDVFAYIIQNDIPYIDVYDKDTFDMPHEIRFSWWYNPSFENQGNVVKIKKNNPELFSRLEGKLPNHRNFL